VNEWRVNGASGGLFGFVVSVRTSGCARDECDLTGEGEEVECRELWG